MFHLNFSTFQKPLVLYDKYNASSCIFDFLNHTNLVTRDADKSSEYIN